MSKVPHPPKMFVSFFRWFCHPDLRKPIEGDLFELYEEQVLELGKKRADMKFMVDVLLLFRKDIIKPAGGTYRLNSYGMFKNYFKVGVRNLLKYKVFSFINVFGLAVAMSLCMFVILLLMDQTSYDDFNSKKDRIFRILSVHSRGASPMATSSFPVGKAFAEAYPLAEKVAQLNTGVGGDASYEGKTTELRGFFADPSFFQVFDFQLIKGDHLEALSAPNAVILSAEKAYELFNDSNPIGQTFQFDERGLNILNLAGDQTPISWGNFTVTGVIDLSEVKSHLKFDALFSNNTLQRLYKENKYANNEDNWDSFHNSYCYVLLDKGANEVQLREALHQFASQKYKDSTHPEFDLIPQKLSQVTPGPIIGNEPSIRLPKFTYYIFSILAAVITIMACLNYTNLSIARSLTRVKEIGVRKVNGASRRQLVFQFLTESFLTVFISLFLALVLLYFINQTFSNFWFNQFLKLDLKLSLTTLGVYFIFTLLLGLIAGAYPSFYLAKSGIVEALKNGLNRKDKKWSMQKVLSVTQFTVSMLFIVTSLVIYNQFKFYTGYDYGFETKNIVNIPLQSNDYQILKSEFEKIPGVEQVSASDFVIATGTVNSTTLTTTINGEDKSYEDLLYLSGDHDYLDLLNIELVAGKKLTSGKNSHNAAIINEEAVKLLGFDLPHEALGATYLNKNNEQAIEIVGVVKNFRATILLNKTEGFRPMVMQNNLGFFNFLNVKLSEGNQQQVIADMRSKWGSIDPTHEFKYTFFEDDLDNTFAAVSNMVSILGYVSFLAIIIACLGLLGMAIYSTERKTKEVGIRKVLGAGEWKIVFLLSRGFLQLVLIAILIAAPLSYFLNNLWLENLAKRAELGVGTVLLGAGILLFLGLLTIGSQTLTASRKNPVDSLKME